MNEKDLMLAMNDIDDDFFDFKEKPKSRKKNLKMLAVAAAAIMIFSITAVAAGRINTSYETELLTKAYGHSVEYYGSDDNYEFDIAKIEYQLEPQKISESAYLEIEEYVSESNDKGLAPGFMHAMFYSVEEVEDFFGIEFCLGEKIREGIRAMGEREKNYNVSDAVIAHILMSENDPTKPIGIVFTFSVDHDFKGNWTTLAVFLSISDEYRESVSGWYSYEKEGKWKEKNYKTDYGKNVVLVYNNPQEGFDGTAFGIWEEEGIGYYLYSRMTQDLAKEAREQLLPYIEDIK